jgi:hypothetical protein
MDENNIPEMKPQLELIRKSGENGNEYWTSRDLCGALGYTTYYKFVAVINKAMKVVQEKGMDMNNHFYLTVEMVQVGSGAYRKVDNYHLSRMACLIIAENADPKKALVKQAREYFKSKTSLFELTESSLSSNLLLYRTNQGEVKIEVVFNNETFWMSQKRMATLFDVEVPTINYHLRQIYESGELKEEATIRKIQIVQQEGERDVERSPLFYNLDAIIAVGYRVNSYQATQFRIWATGILKEFIVKGFVLDDERLKQGKHFGKDYFDDLLQRIREIRTSERRYYQKITDVYAECSADYDSKSETTKLFFKMVQNMMHRAATHQTAAEIIYNRVDAQMPHMGLTSWKKAPEGRIQKSDTIVAKNYLSDKELAVLDRLSSSFLDFAELRAEQQLITTMDGWKQKLEAFLAVSDYKVLKDAGSISNEEAQNKAFGEYEKFKAIQDQHYLSDFDKELKRLRDKGLFND